MSNPYLDPARVRAALRSLNLRPTRGMGQNFLIDGAALKRIVAAAELAPDDLVIEVGPGLGVLTWELLQQSERVLAVELDKRLAARLHEEFGAATAAGVGRRLHILQGDILNLPPSVLLEEATTIWRLAAPPSAPPYKVVANLPYAITSPMLRHFLEAAPSPRLMVVLVQWEVAKRIVASTGRLSMLAHAIQMYAIPEIVERVDAHSFLPPPEVDSAILRLHPRLTPAVAVDDPHAFFRILKAGFLQPRKKLSNALPTGLAALGEPCSREQALAALAAAGVSPDQRAETVEIAQWAAIYHTLRGGAIES